MTRLKDENGSCDDFLAASTELRYDRVGSLEEHSIGISLGEDPGLGAAEIIENDDLACLWDGVDERFRGDEAGRYEACILLLKIYDLLKGTGKCEIYGTGPIEACVWVCWLD